MKFRYEDDKIAIEVTGEGNYLDDHQPANTEGFAEALGRLLAHVRLVRPWNVIARVIHDHAEEWSSCHAGDPAFEEKCRLEAAMEKAALDLIRHWESLDAGQEIDHAPG
jgi:hypothetical protein